VIKGFLESAGGNEANQVNVRAMASSLGIMVEEVKAHEGPDYAEWMHVEATAEDGSVVSAGGTFFGGQSRIVRINGRNVEAAADGVLFLMNNVDKPGMVGYIGSLMGEHQVNIANMSLNRDEEGGEALMLLNLDHAPPAALLDNVAQDSEITNVKVISL
jgi:D-3-phosphoglycerate dehydrogenase